MDGLATEAAEGFISIFRLLGRSAYYAKNSSTTGEVSGEAVNKKRKSTGKTSEAGSSDKSSTSKEGGSPNPSVQKRKKE